MEEAEEAAAEEEEAREDEEESACQPVFCASVQPGKRGEEEDLKVKGTIGEGEE